MAIPYQIRGTRHIYTYQLPGISVRGLCWSLPVVRQVHVVFPTYCCCAIDIHNSLIYSSPADTLLKTSYGFGYVSGRKENRAAPRFRTDTICTTRFIRYTRVYGVKSGPFSLTAGGYIHLVHRYLLL